MLQTKTRIVSIVCNESNKTKENTYKIPMTALASVSVKGVSLKSAVYRNSFYNVVSQPPALKNNVFYFSLDAAPQQFEIPEGFYSISELLPLVQAQMDAILNTRIAPVGSGLFEYSSITGKVTFTYSDLGNGDILELLGGSNPNSINLLLGNVEDFILDGLTPTPYEFKNIIDLSGVDAVQLIIDECSRGCGLSNSSKNNFGDTNNMLSLLNYENSPFGSLKSYINPQPANTMLIYDSGVNLSNMTIYLTTTSGIILDLNSADLHVELLLLLE